MTAEIDPDKIKALCSPEHLLQVADELTARWGRATGREGPRKGGVVSMHDSGRAVGYAQALGLLLDVPFAKIVQDLMKGKL